MVIASRIKNLLDVMSSIAVIGAAGLLMWTFLFRPAPIQSHTQQQVMPVQGLRLDTQYVRHVFGKGRIAIVEFSDFQCPFCARYVQDTLPAIKRDLIALGNVRYVALHYPIEEIHPLALQASEAAECASQQGQFWSMHEELFRAPGAITRPDLIRHAAVLGLDGNAFVRCLDSHNTLAAIRRHQAEARRLGVRGTPAFFIGTVRSDGGIDLVTRIRGAAPLGVFVEQVHALGS